MSKKKKAYVANEQTVAEVTEEINESAPEQFPEPTAVDNKIPPADETETVAEVETASEPLFETVAAPEPETAQTINPDQIDPQYRPLIERLDEQFGLYRDAMASGRPIGERDGAMWQLRLWRLIDSVLKTSGPAFPIVFSHLLGLMANEINGGVMDMRLRFRFLGSLALGSTEGSNFQAILSALLTVANPRDRALRLKQVDINRVFKNYPDRAAVDRVVDFFGL